MKRFLLLGHLNLAKKHLQDNLYYIRFVEGCQSKGIHGWSERVIFGAVCLGRAPFHAFDIGEIIVMSSTSRVVYVYIHSIC